jgi:Cd2+/Zn2+-exporting ATPase
MNGAERSTLAADEMTVRRFRLLSGCVECSGDLTPLRGVAGVREIRLLSATGILAVEVAGTLDEAALLRTAQRAGLVLEPVVADRPERIDRRRQARWWLRPELILLAISAVLLILTELLACNHDTRPSAVVIGYLCAAVGIVFPARAAFVMLRARRVSINLLLVAAVAGAVALGKVIEAACVVVIFSLGVVLESFVADRARASIQLLMQLSPAVAERLLPTGETELVPVEQLQVTDLVLVRPASRLPTDGTVRQGSSWIDPAAITGESMPVEATPGTLVYGGSLNGHAALQIEVSRPFQDTVLARVIREVEQAQQNRGVAQRFADRFGAVYTPLMIAVALLLLVLGPVGLGLSARAALYRALVVLVVSCSCSLVLSVPVSVISALARAAQDGVLIKGGVYLEQLARLRAVVFDKTGTLTHGRPAVTELHPFDGLAVAELLRLAAAVEAGATHPIARAVVQAARQRQILVRPAVDAESVPGIGARGIVDGQLVTVGRPGRLTGAEQLVLAGIEQAGATPVVVAVDGRRVGLLGVADSLRTDAVRAIDGLRSLGITRTAMLTGDRARVAEVIARAAGIEDVRAQLLPDQKRVALLAIKDQAGVTAMVGDGINDTPALASADVAIVMGAAGTDLALETADVALMADDLTRLPYAIALARRAQRIIAQNVTLSLAMILVLVVAAVSGRFSLRQGVIINEAWALVIIGNGLRLLRSHRSLRVIAPSPAESNLPEDAPVSRSELPGSGPELSPDQGTLGGCGAPVRITLPLVQPTPGTSCSIDGSCGCSPASTAREPIPGLDVRRSADDA